MTNNLHFGAIALSLLHFNKYSTLAALNFVGSALILIDKSSLKLILWL
jgi:hypothetical protein